MTLTIDKMTASGSRVFTGYNENRVRMGFEGFADHIGDSGTVTTLKDITLLQPERIGKGMFVGGVYARGARVGSCDLQRGFGEGRVRHTFGPKMLGETPVLQHLQEAWFGGYVFNHFGHFTIEGLSRSISPEVQSSDLPIAIFNMARIETLKPYMAEAFIQFGIDPARVQLINQNTHVAKVHITESALEIRGTVRPARYIEARQKRPPSDRSGIVYLSRSKLTNRRRIEGEANFENRLAQTFGVTVIHPQDHSFVEQLEIFRTASCIVACEGSALHNVIFDGNLPTIVSLSHSFPSLNYFLCDELVDGSSHYVHAAQKSLSADRNAWAIDEDRTFGHVADIFKSEGLL